MKCFEVVLHNQASTLLDARIIDVAVTAHSSILALHPPSRYQFRITVDKDTGVIGCDDYLPREFIRPCLLHTTLHGIGWSVRTQTCRRPDGMPDPHQTYLRRSALRGPRLPLVRDRPVGLAYWPSTQ